MTKMKKIIVIGCAGSGKTTLSEKLHDKLGISTFHLDAIWHKPDRTHISREDFDERLTEILSNEAWIIDGHYNRTLERRIAACDTVLLFDLPTEVCLEGAVSRLGKKRCDMPWTDTELDPWLKNEIEIFPQKHLPVIYELLEKYSEKNIVIFKSRKDADEFLLKLEKMEQ